MNCDIIATRDGGRVIVKPARRLGTERFTQYREVCRLAGAVMHRALWVDACTPAAFPSLYKALAEHFTVAVDPSVAYLMRRAASAIDAAIGAGDDPRLHPYQREGVAYLRARRRALLADQMGLGKTAQLLLAAPPDAPIFVVCPALAKGVWESETLKWRPDLRVSLLSGRGSFRWPRPGEIVVINYDILPSAGLPLPRPPKGTVLIADEAHYCKGTSARARATAALCRSVTMNGGRAWGATGTPLASWPPDLYRVLRTFGLADDAFGSWPAFTRLFSGARDRWGRWSWGKPHRSVPNSLARVMLRRTREQVMPQLPKKSYAQISVPLSEADGASLSRLLFRARVRPEEITEASLGRLLRSAHIMEARKILATAKISHAIEWASAAEEADEPVVIFCAHRAPVLAFENRPGWAVIVGDTPPEERTRIAERFQNGELKGIAATIDAGGSAITLTRSCMALFVDLEWTPAANSQAEDRLVRIGQERPVTIYSLVANHDLDVRVAGILASKAVTLALSVEAITATPDSVIAEQLRSLSDRIEAANL